MKSKLIVITLICICFLKGLFSQGIELYEGTVQTQSVTNSGESKIVLTPKLRSVANSNYSDLRIYNTENKEVAYFVDTSRAVDLIESNFIPIKNEIINKNKETEILVLNEEKKRLNSLIVFFNNAKVKKKCKVEGSNTKDKWFVILDSVNLNFIDTQKQSTDGYYQIDFPSTNYKYIRLLIDDSKSSPIDIKNVGWFKRNRIEKKITYDNLNLSYTVKEEGKNTLIHVVADYPNEIDRIEWDIKKPTLYNRVFQIYNTINGKKEYAQSFNLNSEKKNNFDLNFNKKDFWIKIENKDNQPLDINTITFFQKKEYIIALLKENSIYKIKVGDKKLKKPQYDLENFKDKISANLDQYDLTNEKIEKIIKKTKIVEKKFYETKWFLWCSLILAGIIIIGFTIRLMKDMETR